jgi:hypothetical protein
MVFSPPAFYQLFQRKMNALIVGPIENIICI